MESGKGAAAVFLAFDSVPYKALIEKLQAIGLDLVQWITNYLTNHIFMQYVVVIGVASKSLHVISCVPQGSVLGPLLFLIYTNAIAELPLSPESQLVMYADNILLYGPIRQAPAYQLLQQDVEALGEWVNNNILHLILQNRKPWYFQEMTN